MEKKEEILRVRNLDISFETTAGVVNAVRGVNLTVNRGETVAIVGESGSGKSVSAKAIMGILAKNGTIDRGQITFSYYRNPEERVTREILQMKKEEIRRHINGKRIAMVFQDPMTSLNPLMPVGKQIMEGMIWHYHTPKEEAYKKALELMKLVGITDAEETVAIVGESGSGKSVSAKAIMGILAKNGTIDRGQITFSYYRNPEERVTREILQMKKEEIRRHINGKRIAMVFQDPMTSLNPLMPVGKQIMEGMIWHYHTPKEEAYKKALELMKLVGITDAEKRIKNYPHQLSGGMRQRIVIAIALACDPELLICDEPTTALDVTIQSKILELIQEIQKKRQLSVIYITHDLGVVAKVADYVNVMYAGKIVESGTVEDVFYDPRHPYTWGLLSAMPDLGTDDERLYTIPGSPPNLLHKVTGDAFAPRNKYALNIDSRLEPPMFKISETHSAATWLLHPKAPKVDMPPELRDRIERMKKEGGIA